MKMQFFARSFAIFLYHQSLVQNSTQQLPFALSEGDVRLPKLFRQTVPQRWPGSGKTAVTELVA